MMLEGKLFCSIYKSKRKAETYLYVARQKGLAEVPKALLEQFGPPQHVADMILSPDRPLARVEVDKVMEKIRQQGFYLQMPPPPEDDLYLAKGHPDNPAKDHA